MREELKTYWIFECIKIAWNDGNTDMGNNAQEEMDALRAHITELEQGWIPNEPDSWNFCPYPCEVRYDANGKPTHHRQLPPEDK